MARKPILAPMNEYERVILLPLIAKCLKHHVGREQAITNSRMCEALQDNGYEIKEARMRKIIHFIRDWKLIKRGCLIASNRGYHVSVDVDEVRQYIESLKGRVEAILVIIRALEEQLEELRHSKGTAVPSSYNRKRQA